ncbi:hypothetical protein D3C86_1287000 [compost metagenome]
MSRVWPEMYDPAGDASKIAAPTISSGSAMRLEGDFAAIAFTASGVLNMICENAVRTIDGAKALARMFHCPHSAAMLRTTPFSAALAAP